MYHLKQSTLLFPATLDFEEWQEEDYREMKEASINEDIEEPTTKMRSNKNKVKEEQDKERKVRRKLQREGIEPIKQVRKSERLKGKRMK